MHMVDATGNAKLIAIAIFVLPLSVFSWLLPRLTNCNRSSGDWFGVANAYAAESRLYLAKGRFREAADGFQLALEVSSPHFKE